MLIVFTEQCSDPLLAEFIEKLKTQYPMTEDEEYEAMDWIREHVHFIYPEDSIYGQRIRANLIFATEDEANRDFDCYSNFHDDWKLPAECMVSKFIGMFRRESEFKRATEVGRRRMDSDTDSILPISRDVTVESTIEELWEFSSVMGAFTVLLDVSLEEFVQLLKLSHDQRKRSIRLLPGTTCGIFNPWIGAGSEMNIRFEKVLTIPSQYLWSVWADGTKTFGYDPGDVYGFSSDVWTKTGYILDH